MEIRKKKIRLRGVMAGRRQQGTYITLIIRLALSLFVDVMVLPRHCSIISSTY